MLIPDVCTMAALMALPEIHPTRSTLRSDASNYPEWLFEVKNDGFRGLAYVDSWNSRLI